MAAGNSARLKRLSADTDGQSQNFNLNLQRPLYLYFRSSNTPFRRTKRIVRCHRLSRKLKPAASDTRSVNWALSHLPSL